MRCWRRRKCRSTGPRSNHSFSEPKAGRPGLYLAAIALRQSPDPTASAERFAGDDRVVADYMHDEALRAFPTDSVTS